MNDEKGDNMLTRQEAANYLKCSVALLAKIAYTEPGAIPQFKIGKRVLYRKSDLDSFIESRKH